MLCEISRFRVVQLKFFTEPESAFLYKDSNLKYVYVLVPEGGLKFVGKLAFFIFLG